jgi:hypothetical protein
MGAGERKMDDRPEVNGLPLPLLLVQLIENGHWSHPGDEILLTIMPFLDGPVDFLSIESMRRESRFSLAKNPETSDLFRMAPGRNSAKPVDLPWLDTRTRRFSSQFAGSRAMTWRLRLITAHAPMILGWWRMNGRRKRAGLSGGKWPARSQNSLVDRGSERRENDSGEV